MKLNESYGCLQLKGKLQDSTSCIRERYGNRRHLAMWLAQLRRSCQYSERFLIEVNSVDTAIQMEAKHEQNGKSSQTKQKYMVLTTGITAVWEVDAEEHGGKGMCIMRKTT